MSTGIAARKLRLKRAHEPPAPGDGTRALVDRLWPRGVGKDAAALDLWLKDLAPSTVLRQWFGHDPAHWAEFRKRYRASCTSMPSPSHVFANWRAPAPSRWSIRRTTKSTTTRSSYAMSCWAVRTHAEARDPPG